MAISVMHHQTKDMWYNSHAHPNCLLLQVASVVLDTVGVLQPGQKPNNGRRLKLRIRGRFDPPYLLEYVLPLLQGLLPVVGHLLDGHHLVRDVVPRKDK